MTRGASAALPRCAQAKIVFAAISATMHSRSSVNSSSVMLLWGQLARPSSPSVAQLPKPEEHRLRIGLFGQVRKTFAQLRDHARAGEAKEGVDALLLVERGDDRGRRVVARHPRQQRLRVGVVR